MTDSLSRKDQLKQLLKEKNISIAVLALQAGKSRSSLNSLLKSSHMMSEESFQFYKKIVDSIDTENYYEKYVRGKVFPKKEAINPDNDNKQKIRDFLKSHDIRIRLAANICNRTNASFLSLINRSASQKISDGLYEEIISKLEAYVRRGDSKRK